MGNGERKNKNIRSLLSFQGVLAVVLAIGLLAAAIAFQFYNKLHETLREESRDYLQEVASRIGSNIDRIIEDNYSVLYMLSAEIETMEFTSFRQVQLLLEEQQTFWSFDSMLLIDEDGRAYEGSQKEVLLSFDAGMRSEILAGGPTMSTTQVVGNRERVLFAVPLPDIVLDGRRMIALAASYDPASFTQALSMESFGGQAYSQIITKSGTIVTRNSSEDAIKSGYNIFSKLEQADMEEGSSIEGMEADFRQDRRNQIGFTLDGVRRYMVYMPLQPKEWYLATFVPVSVINQRSDLLLQSTLVICAVIVIAFSLLNFLLFYSFRKHRRKLEQIAYVDAVTGGNTIQRFYQIARKSLDAGTESFALVYTNMEKFKLLNDQLGREKCDWLLCRFHDYVSMKLSGKECVGRIAADNFCMLVRYPGREDLLERFREWKDGIRDYLDNEYIYVSLPAVEFGIYVIKDTSMTFPRMIDRAKLALRQLHESIENKMRFAFYDDRVRHRMVREKELEDRMERALTNHEFQVYLQPKYHLPEEKILGAEALVRWFRPGEGMIYPDEFIPLFERNEFIVSLDLWVFEEVCRMQRRWRDQGREVIRVSVNCSRIHLKDPDFLKPYEAIADRWNIDRGRIEIELTESIVMENQELLTHIIEGVKKKGFACSMDDFGSGYSSLNLIQSIPVDTLKMDKIFFRNGVTDLERTLAVVTSIVGMARALGMETVAEGVEHRPQVEMLKKAGCDYIQGFVFARPMELEEFEKLVFKG